MPDSAPLETQPAARLSPGEANGRPAGLTGRGRRFVRREELASPAELGIPEGGTGVAVARRDRSARRVLALADVGSAAVALFIAIVVLGHGDALKPTVLACLPLLVLVNKAAGLYDRDQHLLHRTTLEEAPTVLQAATLSTLIIFFGQGAFVDGWFGRDQMFLLLFALVALTLVGRAAARFALRRTTPPDRCLLIGDPLAAEQVRSKLERSQGLNAELVGRVPLDSDGEREDGVPVLGGIDMLGVVVMEHDVERVIIAPGRSDPEQILRVIKLVRALGVKVSVLPRMFEAVGSSVEFDDIEGIVLLGVRDYGLSRSSRMLKRGMDLVCSAAALLLLAPLLVLAAIAIKLNSRGPVLFRQRRIGLDGQDFEMLKFRTMVDGADGEKEGLLDLNEAGEGLFKIEDDPRITWVGRFLRRTGLDELPQLINVLRGEMSIVGPRPLVPDEDRLVEDGHPRRLHLTPGITGIWQIYGSSRIPLQEMAKLDYLYGANWSLWLDLKVVLRTVPYALSRRGL